MKLGVPWIPRGKRPSESAPSPNLDASVHERIDNLARQSDRLARKAEVRPLPAERGDDRRPPVREPPRKAVEDAPSKEVGRYAGDRRLNREPLRPSYAEPSLDDAIAEITARQRALDGRGPSTQPRRSEKAAPPHRRPAPPPARPEPAAPDLSGLEDKLRAITAQIESLRTPPGLEETVPALRQELVEISRSLAEAMPRRAIEAIESDIRALAQRLDETRNAGGDGKALANIESGLAEVRDALHGLTPTESLEGFQSTIQSLNRKVDAIAASQQDPTILRQLEAAVTGLRSIVAHVASDEALARLTEEIGGLSAKVERFAEQPTSPEALSNIEYRVGALAEALYRRNARHEQLPDLVETTLKTLTEKIEKLQLSRADTIAFGQLEDRIRELVEKLAPAEVKSSLKTLTEKIETLQLSRANPIDLGQIEDRISELAEKLAPEQVKSGLKALTEKIETLQLSRANPIDLGQIEDRISELAEKLAPEQVKSSLKTLTEKVETLQLSRADPIDFGQIDDRISELTEKLAPEQVKSGLKTLTEKIETLQLSRADTIAFGQLEDRISKLVEKLDSSGGRLGHLEAIERGLADLIVYLETQRGKGGSRTQSGGDGAPEIDSLKRGLAGINNTLNRVVERLATIESGIRTNAQAAPLSVALSTQSVAAQPAPAMRAPSPSNATAAVPAAPAAESLGSGQSAADAIGPAPLYERLAAAAAAQDRPSAPRDHQPIDPNLPPDHPIEPGAAGRTRPPSSPSDRIAASEAALGPTKPPVLPDPGGKSNFIAAARRAAQAATRLSDTLKPTPQRDEDVKVPARKRWGARLRSFLIGGSVVALAIGAVYFITNLVVIPDPPAQHEVQSAPESRAPMPARAKAPVTIQPLQAPKPPNAHSSDTATGVTPYALAPQAPHPAETLAGGASSKAAHGDVTGSIPSAPAALAPAKPSSPPLPPRRANGQVGIEAAHGLAAAASAGDPAAAYALGMRYLQGRGVQQSYADAARWLEPAAKRGLAPAQFRLASLYEKGHGVKQDLQAAQRLYRAAAEKGNAKAMHNLAVLYAEGIDGKPAYKIAAQWFQKAAEYGVTDSQYNLAVLYARGFGVEQNLAEAYKWFSLAALHGDHESARKRDEIAKRLDAQSLMAAKLAVKTWTAKPEPKEAVTVPEPVPG